MIKVIRNRIEQGCKTSKYPKEPINLYKRYRGRPEIHKDADPELIKQCAEACPQDAIDAEKVNMDLGRCTFCGQCETISEGKFVSFTQNFEMGTTSREDLITDGSFADLAENKVSILTIGQYLSPSSKHLPVDRYVHPNEFDSLAKLARSAGIRSVFSGPLVRSSYMADHVFSRLSPILRGFPSAIF